jgi:hypothetical protein
VEDNPGEDLPGSFSKALRRAEQVGGNDPETISFFVWYPVGIASQGKTADRMRAGEDPTVVVAKKSVEPVSF